MSRREEIAKVQQEYGWFYHGIVYAGVLIAGVLFGAFLFGEREGYDINLWTEALGVVAGAGVTLFILDRINDRRHRQREELELRARLRRQARSSSHDIVIGAIEELRYR